MHSRLLGRRLLWVLGHIYFSDALCYDSNNYKTKDRRL